MAAVPITLTISLCLAFTFVLFFICERLRGRGGDADHDSLLPLADEAPRLAPIRPDGGKGCSPGCRKAGCNCKR